MYFIWYKNGLVALPTCVVNPGEKCATSGSWIYRLFSRSDARRCQSGSIKFRFSRLFAKWDNVDKRVLDNTTLVYLTYPNNPTGSTATKEVFDEAIERFKGTNTKLCTTLLIVLLALMLKSKYTCFRTR